MAMIKCKECKKEVSDKAKVCTNCGAPIKKGQCGTCLLYLIGFLILAAILGNVLSECGKPSQVKPVNNVSEKQQVEKKISDITYQQVFYKTNNSDFTIFAFLVSSKKDLNRNNLSDELYNNLRNHGLSQTSGTGNKRSYYFIDKNDMPELSGITDIDKIDDILYKSKHIAFVHKYPNGNPLKQQELFKNSK